MKSADATQRREQPPPPNQDYRHIASGTQHLRTRRDMKATKQRYEAKQMNSSSKALASRPQSVHLQLARVDRDRPAVPDRETHQRSGDAGGGRGGG